MSNRGLRTLAAIAAIAAGAALIYRLIAGGELSTEAPDYASISTAPTGTSALFGAYARAGLAVDRGWDVDGIAAEPPEATTAFVIAPSSWDEELDRQLDAFVRQGGRLVLVAPPWVPDLPPPLEGPNQPAPPAAGGGRGSPAPAPAPPPAPALEMALGARLEIRSSPAGPILAEPVPGAMPAGTAPLPLWQSGQSLDLEPGWTPLFRRGRAVYMAMRPLGRGTVVVASEPGFLTNDALAQTSDPALFTWLAGGRSRVFVDETGHGLARQRGILWLMERYRLQAALLLLLSEVALAWWALAAGLEMPPASPSGEEEPALPAVEDAMVGWRRLLERAVPPGELPALCWRQFAERNPAVARRLRGPQAGADAAVAWFNRMRKDRERLLIEGTRSAGFGGRG